MYIHRATKGLDINNIFVYLNVIARVFQFGRVCWSWYLQYFCIFDCYCKNISLWESVLVLKSTISLYICILACYCKNISLWEGVLALKGQIYRRNYNKCSPPPEPCLAPSLASIYVAVSPPNYDNVRFPPPWGMRWGNKTGGETRGETGGKTGGEMRGEAQGKTGGKTRGETGGKTRGETGDEIFVIARINFNLGGSAGLDIYNIFVYLNVIARIFHFGRVFWS